MSGGSGADRGAGRGAGAPWLDEILAITFDFGNTLVPFPAGPMHEVLVDTARAAAELTGCSVEDFVRIWNEERLRQFAEDVPEGREADMDRRVVRVLARLDGVDVPVHGSRWNDAEIARRVRPDRVGAIVDAYAEIFARLTPIPAEIGPMLARLASHYRLGLISNWPLSLAVERYLQIAGWAPFFRAVVISQTIGSIKPHPQIFRVAAEQLGIPSGPSILHVGDDVGADVAGAMSLGWRTAWVRVKPEDSTLPVAPPAPDAIPDLVVDRVTDLEAALARAAGRGAP